MRLRLSSPISFWISALPRTKASVPALTSANSWSKLFPMVSVSTRLPAMKATPRSTRSLGVNTRSLRARSPAMVVLRTFLLPELLEPVEGALGGGVVHRVDDASVVEEDDAAGVGGGDGVVGHHDD